MNKNTSFFRDCTEYCRSIEHGNLITDAITKRSTSDLELCSYLNYICTNCESVRDSLGRTALHVAASCGRIDLVRWLVNIKNANLNLKDEESGYTPLHRALFYGKINVAVQLIKLGANQFISDMDSLTTLEHVTKDGQLPSEDSGILYTWGLNNNNSLGSFTSGTTPECSDNFHKRNPKALVQQVCIDKFHSVIVTKSGEVYSCGHGLDGRLGLGTEKTIVVTTKIDFNSTEKVIIMKSSIARNHCLFLSYDHMLYSCGSNKHKVLGLSASLEKVLTPQKIKLNANILGISTGRYHSVAWTNKILYTWGLNAGQLGHEINENYYVTIPRKVKLINVEDSSIEDVASSDGAIAVLTGKGDVYVLHEYKCRKIASRQLDIVNIAVIGGTLNTTIDKELKLEPAKELKVIVRTNLGNLLLWQETDQQLCRCIFSIPRALVVRQVTININEILFVTNFGEAYRGVIKPRKKKTIVEKKNNFHNYLVKEECIIVKLTKIPRIHRAIYIKSDPRGEDYCVIQQSPYNENLFQEKLPASEMKKQLSDLLREANEDDYIHDIKIKIENRIFPCHKYILAQRSQLLQNVKKSEEELNLKDIKVDLFEEMLTFIYTGTCELLQVGRCPEKFRKYCSGYSKEEEEKEIIEIKQQKKSKTIQNPVRMLQEISKRFGCSDLYKILANYGMQGCFIYKKCDEHNDKVVIYQMKQFPEFYDVAIKTSDNKEIMAHKCILAARMEYFNSMFSVRWNSEETATVTIPYPSVLVEAFLEFIYTDSVNFLSKKDCDFLLKLLVLADEYLVNQLKNHCSSLLLTLTYLDLKNAVEILKFAHYYEANSLKEGVMKYIVNNMAYFLETQALNDLSDDILKDLSQSYFEQRDICCRVITPYSTAVSDETISEVNNTYPVNTEVPENKKLDKTSSKHPKRRIRTKNTALENSVKKCFDKEKENLDSFIQFPDNSDASETQTSVIKSVSNTQKRLSAITSAFEVLESESCESEFINLRSRDVPSSLEDFPLLNSPPDGALYSLSNSPSQGRLSYKQEGRHRMVRLSQRERKRLSSESKDVAPVIPESPKNPWKIIAPETTSPIVSPSSGSTFCDILSNERKQKENFAKMSNKLLKHTQLEDKAIVELEKFYNIDIVEDEIISVQRVEMGCIASPIWVPKHQIHS